MDAGDPSAAGAADQRAVRAGVEQVGGAIVRGRAAASDKLREVGGTRRHVRDTSHGDVRRTGSDDRGDGVNNTDELGAGGRVAGAIGGDPDTIDKTGRGAS